MHKNFRPIKVLDLELSSPIQPLSVATGYGYVWILVRLHEEPLGFLKLPIQGGGIAAVQLRNAVLRELGWPIFRHLLGDKLSTGLPKGTISIADLEAVTHPDSLDSFPNVTVAVCTRDRTEQLDRCLKSLAKLDYPKLEFLVIDNAPESQATARLVRDRFPEMRYIYEPRAGLNAARNRAIVQARGEIIAFTDDDVTVDPGWARAVAEAFVRDPEVMAVTGLVVPMELETEAQQLYEASGGFGRGFERRLFRVPRGEGLAAERHAGTGGMGTGANMAFRRRAFQLLGCFDPALDTGTRSRGGGDLEMFFRLVKEGYLLVYEPGAIVRHSHRRECPDLSRQLRDHGTGFFAYLTRSALAYPEERMALARFGLRWLRRWNGRRLRSSMLGRSRLPVSMVLHELYGTLLGPLGYFRARREARSMESLYGPCPELLRTDRLAGHDRLKTRCPAHHPSYLGEPPIETIAGDRRSSQLIRLTCKGLELGKVEVPDRWESIGSMHLRESIPRDKWLRFLQEGEIKGISFELS